MYALTIRNDGPTPWVDLILNGEKTVEFRRWKPRLISYGGRFAIHEAGRGVVAVALLATTNPIGLGGLYPGAPRHHLKSQPGCPSEVEIGKAFDARPWYAWKLSEVAPVDCVECPGKQGLWKLPDDIEMAVIEQLAQGVML